MMSDPVLSRRNAKTVLVTEGRPALVDASSRACFWSTRRTPAKAKACIAMTVIVSSV